MKSTWRIWSCIWAVGVSACGVSNSELPDVPGPGTYGNAGTDGEAGAAASAGAGGSGAIQVGSAGRTAAAGSGAAGKGAAGMAAVGGSGGAGAGGVGALAGSGGGGAGGMLAAGGQPAAGSGGMAAAGSGGGAACPTDYTMATHIVINVSWDGTLALSAGSGKVDVWTRSHFVENGSTASVESRSCGSVLPAITTTAIAGSEKILPEIPDAAWDVSSMPTFAGTATRSGDIVNVDPGVALLGLSLGNPRATWPAATSITGVDHDGDGKGGVTANLKQTGGFVAVPTNLAKSSRADKIYLAIRNIMTLSATAPGCPETYSGTANVTNFENHVIGCHVKGGSECDSTQSKFVDDNRTIYKLGSASFTSQRVAADVSCADVRALLP